MGTAAPCLYIAHVSWSRCAMRKTSPWILALFLLAASLSALVLRQGPSISQASAQPADEGLTSILVLCGELQSAPRKYDGSVQLSQGRVVKLIPYRLFGDDAMVAPESWKLTTKRVVFENRSGRPTSLAGGGAPQNIVSAGIIAVVSAPGSAQVKISVAEKTVNFSLEALQSGQVVTALDGDVTIVRVPTISKISEEGTGEQNDYPALLDARNGDLWVAWQAYRDRGDHVYARRRTSSWGAAERLTADKGDLLRPVLGEDAAGGIHVVWSERSGEDWNLVEQRYDGRSWSTKRTITSGPGTNIYHRMSSDPRGNLHMVWMAHKNVPHPPGR